MKYWKIDRHYLMIQFGVFMNNKQIKIINCDKDNIEESKVSLRDNIEN